MRIATTKKKKKKDKRWQEVKKLKPLFDAGRTTIRENKHGDPSKLLQFI